MDPASITASQALVGLGVASAGTSAFSAFSQASQARNQARLQRSQDELALAENERDSQLELAKTLAARNNLFAATGTDPTGGSALSVMMADKAAADRTLTSIQGRRGLVQGAYGSAMSNARSNLAGGLTGSLLKLGMTGYYAYGGGLNSSSSNDYSRLSSGTSGYSYGGMY